MKIKANKILAVLCVIAMIMTMIVPMTLTAAAEDELSQLCNFSTVSGTQYANETKSFGNHITVSTYNKGCHFNTQLRIYDSASNNGYAVVKLTDGYSFTKLTINVGYKAATLKVYGSNDGTSWNTIQDIETATSYKDYTVEASGYSQIKLDASGAQLRVAKITANYVAVESSCDHTNTLVIGEDKAPTCTEPGSTAGLQCANPECNFIVTPETILPALGHTFVNGVCECGELGPIYSYTFSNKIFTNNGDKKLGDITWTLAGDGGYWNTYDATKGQQFGSGSLPYTTLTLTSEAFENVSKVVINTSGASDTNATLTATVNGTKIGDTIAISSSATEYEFISDTPITGSIEFKYTQTSKKAIYIKSIEVYSEAPKAEITQMSVNVKEDLALLAHVTFADDENAEDYKVVFTHENAEIGEEIVANIVDGKATLDNIAPQAMADVFTVQLMKGDTKVGDAFDYSIKDYVKTVLADEEASAELKAFVSDMLVYGAAAQQYTGYNTDNLATDGMDQIEGYNPSVFDAAGAEESNIKSVSGNVAEDLGFKTIGVKFENTLSVYAKFATDDVTVTINGADIELVEKNGVYYAYSEEIKAAEFGKAITVVVTKGTATQTYTYSVNSFAYAQSDNANETIANLAQALYNYGYSANKLA